MGCPLPLARVEHSRQAVLPAAVVIRQAAGSLAHKGQAQAPDLRLGDIGIGLRLRRSVQPHAIG